MMAFATVQGVHKQFATVTAVNDVSFEVREREIFALLGPNGAGKTTLLRMLLGLIHPDRGTIAFGGAGEHRAARNVGYLPEDRGLYPDVAVIRTLTYFGTLRGMPRRDAQLASEKWLERMGLSDRRHEPLKSLSKGNQQKVQFISAVLHSPSFVVLDEPFSGLDPLNQDMFLALIGELRDGGATVVLSAHQMQLVERIADRVLVLNRGSTVLEGSIPEIRKRWTTGKRLLVRVGKDAPAEFLADRAPRVAVKAIAPDQLELIIADDEPLGPLLAEIGARLDVRDIESHPVMLHDVYVGTIGRQDAEEVGA